MSTAYKRHKLEQLRQNKKKEHDPVHFEGRGWWFWDETWADRYGPYATETVARQALDDYVKNVLGGEVA